jgi:hypothetical protein
MQDLWKVSQEDRKSGANGMTAEQAVRAGIAKQMFNFTRVKLH